MAAFQNYDKEQMARVIGKDLAVSTKHCIEICRFIKGKKLESMISYLEATIKLKQPIPFKKYTNGAGHKAGKMDAGKYPVKAAKAILKLLNGVKANSISKGFSTVSLKIIHANANLASRPFRYGRIRGESKRSHVEIVVKEVIETTNKKDNKKETKEPKQTTAGKKTATKTDNLATKKKTIETSDKDIKPSKTNDPIKQEQNPAKTTITDENKRNESKIQDTIKSNIETGKTNKTEVIK